MKVGMVLPCTHPYESNEMALQLATSLDVDSVWVSDHLLGVYHPEIFAETALGAYGDSDGLYDPFALAGALGRQTHMPIGISVTDAIRRRSGDVARTALTLQHMCKGGFNLGVGSGELENLTPFGYPTDKLVGRTEEFLGELRHLLDTGRMPTGVGRTGIPLESDNGKPRVWVAAHRRRMLRLTGQYGDGWLPVWPMSPEEYGEKREVVCAHAAAAGRPAPEAGLMVPFILGSSREAIAEAVLREPLTMLTAVWVQAEVWRRHGLEHPWGTNVDTIPHEMDPQELRDLARTIPFELFEEQFWAGTAEELARKMEGYVKEGCEHIVLINTTGIVGGVPEIEARVPDLYSLRQMVGEL